MRCALEFINVKTKYWNEIKMTYYVSNGTLLCSPTRSFTTDWLTAVASIIVTTTTSLPQSNLGRGPRRRKSKSPSPSGAPQIHRSPNPTTCLIPGPVRPMMPTGIRNRPAVFPQWTGQTDRRTDAQTDRSSTGKFDDYRLRYESDAA